MSAIRNREGTSDELMKSPMEGTQIFKRPTVRRSLRRKSGIDAENDENQYEVKERRRRSSNSTSELLLRTIIIEKPLVDSPPITPRKITTGTQVSNRETQDGDPLALTSLAILKKNFEESNMTSEKLILTPVKARKFSISSEVEYDRILESIQENQTEQDYTIDAIKFVDDFDVIEEILQKKELENLHDDQLNFEADNSPEIKCFDDQSGKENDRVNKRKNSEKLGVQMKKQRRSSKCVKIEQESACTITAPARKLSETMIESEPRSWTENGEHFFEGEENEILNRVFQEPLPESVIEKFRSTNVKLQHKVPPQHEIEQSILRDCLTAEQKAKFKTYGPLKEGRFTIEEDAIIRKNWKSFCRVHGLDFPEKNFFKSVYIGRRFIADPLERRKFWQFLANELPWRTLRSVSLRFRALYGYKTESQNNRRYTEEEDAKIMKYMKSDDLPVKKSKILPEILDRSYVSIGRRYRQLLEMEERKKCKEVKSKKDAIWSLDLIEDFLRHLMDITISEDIADLKDSLIPKSVWLKLESLLNITHEALKDFWTTHLHMQLFAPRPIYYNQIKIMLVEYLYGKGIVSFNEIDWSEVAKCFDGYTPQFLIRMCPRPRHRAEFGDYIEKMYKELIPILKEKPYDHCLPRLRYSNRKLEVIDIVGGDSEIDE
uniref:Myb-like domain-containing protein n=1 Tax=Bracon brevicornis TaxID=1563983 RepID=A0A6V7KED5_9HYME